MKAAARATILACMFLSAALSVSASRKMLLSPWDPRSDESQGVACSPWDPRCAQEVPCSPWDPRCADEGNAPAEAGQEDDGGSRRKLQSTEEQDRYIQLPCDCHTVILHDAKTSQLICYKNELGASPSAQCSYSKIDYTCGEELTLPAGLVGPLAGTALICSYLKDPTTTESAQ